MAATGLTGHFTSKLVIDRHPVYDRKRCVNAVQARVHCHICEAACTRGAIPAGRDFRDVDFNACDDCTVCAAHCPGGALSFSPQRIQALLRLLEQKIPLVVLGCGEAGCDTHFTLPCLSSYPFEVLSILALNGRVRFVHGDCASCPMGNTLALFERTLKETELFLGTERYEAVFLEEEGEAHDTGLPRREAFRALFESGLRSAYTLLPEELTGRQDGDMLRRILTARWAAFQKEQKETEGREERVTWRLPLFTEQCIACGICEKVCVNDTLHVVRDEEDSLYLTHASWHCRGCGICEAVCPYGGINGYGLIETARADAAYLHRTDADEEMSKAPYQKPSWT